MVSLRTLNQQNKARSLNKTIPNPQLIDSPQPQGLKEKEEMLRPIYTIRPEFALSLFQVCVSEVKNAPMLMVNPN